MMRYINVRFTYLLTLSSEDKTTAPDNTYRKFCEVWVCVFQDMQVDRQTDRLTDMLIAIFCTPLGAK